MDRLGFFNGRRLLPTVWTRGGFLPFIELIDYVINWNPATRPWLIVRVGPCFALLHFAISWFAITKFDLAAPGREPEGEAENSARS